MVIVIWVGSALLIQAIFNGQDTQFNKPLFLTYYSTSFFTLYLIPLGIEFLYLMHNASRNANHNDLQPVHSEDNSHQNEEVQTLS